MASNDLKRKSGDVGWEYGETCGLNRDKVKCRLCSKIVHGGITRLKQHIAGVGGQVVVCPRASPMDKERCRSAIEGVKKKKNEAKERLQELRDAVHIGNTNEEVLSCSSKKSPHSLGPMDEFARPIQLTPSSSKELKQKRVDDELFKKRTEEVHAILAKWVYASGAPFNCINNDEWKQLVEAIGQFGPGYESPSQYKLREPLLKQQVEKMRASLGQYREEWKNTGCSLMTDAWSDRKRMSIMNLCVNCKLGTTFLSSKEDSMEEHTGIYIFEYVDGFIEKEIGEEYVVQVVTDNATNNMAAAKLLKIKRPNIFWTSCATHTINLILEGIGNLPKFKKTIQKAKALTIFIYSHHKTLALMRRYCKNKEIVRPGATRFATSFLTLQSLLDKRGKLREMFFSSEYSKCKHSKTSKGKKSEATVCSHSFWGDVDLCVRIFEPLVRVLKLVDGDVKPSMGFVVGYLNDAKEKIKSVCVGEGEEALLRSIFAIVESKSKDRLDSPLHLASYMLNPMYFYRNDVDEVENRCIHALDKVVDAIFYGQVENQLAIVSELLKYKMKDGSFGKTTAIAYWEKHTDVEFDPVAWWNYFGRETPNLKKVAIRILSLTSSSSGCERNWSTFEGIHTKKRNRLDATRLNDLVFVQFNSKLQTKRARSSQKKDPLACNDDTMAQGWKVKGGDDEIDKQSDTYMGISCELIASAMGADEVMEDRSSARNKGKNVLVDDDEEENSDDDDDEIDEDEDNESIPSDSAEDEDD